MSDVFTKAKGTDLMSHIRGRDHKDNELALANVLRTAGITSRYRYAPLFGNPNFTFRKRSVVALVDG